MLNEGAVLVILSAAGAGSTNLTAGSGYTLGISATVATYGQVEYQLNAAPGQTTAAFTGTEPYWGTVAMAFAAGTGTAPAFTSPANATFTAGANSAFAVTTSGSPAPSLTSVGTLPAGVTFHDNGDGTAALGGLVNFGATGVYGLMFTASNTNGTATQDFTLTVLPPSGSAGTTASGQGSATSAQTANVFTYRTLGPNNDPVWTSYYSNVYAVAQAIKTIIDLFMGEWWESVLDGTPMFQKMLGAPGSATQQVSLLLQQRILGTPYVTGISDLTVNFDAPSRIFSMTCTAQTAFGPTNVVYSPQPPSQGIP